MLNKIKIIGKIQINKEKKENKLDETDTISQEIVSEIDKSQPNLEAEKENNRGSWFYFSLLVPAPSNSLTILRCIAQGEVAERIKNEIEKEAKEEKIIEVRGYLRNEKIGRQIVIRVVEFNKLELNFNEIDLKNSNQVRLLGKIITDLQSPENKKNLEILSFKLTVPREGVKSPLFFCRVNEKKLIPEVNEQLKKGDVILLEGFLQTQKIVKETGGDKKEISWISSIICYGFTFLDSDSVDVFSPLDNLTRVVKEVSKTDFSKPKDKKLVEEQTVE